MTRFEFTDLGIQDRNFQTFSWNLPEANPTKLKWLNFTCAVTEHVKIDSFKAPGDDLALPYMALAAQGTTECQPQSCTTSSVYHVAMNRPCTANGANW